MKGFVRKSILVALVFAAIAGASAQNRTSSKSTTIEIVAVVPAVLRVSLDFSQDSTAQIAGYIPNDASLRSDIAYSKNGNSRFEIKSGTTVNLGNARLFSNVVTSYSVNVYSANDGSLRDSSGVALNAIPYQLCLGDATATAKAGTFSFAAAGKHSKNAEPLKVALMINDVPQTAVSGFYSDQLMFSVSAN